MNNIYELTRAQIIEKLEELKFSCHYRNQRAPQHKKLIALVADLEKRLAQLEAKSKLDWAKLL